MNLKQKQQVKQLRQNGLGYKSIADILEVSVNTVKSYCKRENISRNDIVVHELCPSCGFKLEHTNGKKQKKFCSDACRMKWWNKHPEKVNRKSFSNHICDHCQTSFESYVNTSRKYCSRTCYQQARFGSGKYE